MNATMKKSMLLAGAVAGILSAGAAMADEIPAHKIGLKETVPCYGVNACAGKGDCSGPNHGCHAQNKCKGAGWLPMPKDSCLALQGGSLEPTKKHLKKG